MPDTKINNSGQPPKGPLDDFFNASTEGRLRMVLAGNLTAELKEYLGEPAFAEYLDIAQRTTAKLDQEHLGPEPETNLIFVPGVMGSLLFSENLGGVWWIDARTRKHIDDLKLSPDGAQDANPTHTIRAFTTDITYEPFLAAVLQTDKFRHTVFAYDWRKSVLLSADALKQRILDTYESNGNSEVHLVAHSMGGLVVRATLMKHGAELWDKIGRIAFVATPHYGSPGIAGYLKNHLWGFELMALLGLYLSRETFRSMWGVLSMLPAPRGIYPGTRKNDPEPWHSPEADDPYVHPCANFDMYDAGSWKLDLKSPENPLGLNAHQESELQAILNGARDFHQQLYDWHRSLNQKWRDKMAVIAGVGEKTLFRLAYKKKFLGYWEDVEKVTSSVKGDRHREGDCRVPLASAALEDVGETRYTRGEHGGLPMIPAVYEDVFRWLSYEPMQLPETMTEALSRHLGGTGTTTEAPALTSPMKQGEEADFWNLTPPSDEVLKEMDERLAAGQLPGFIKVRLL